LLDPDANVRQAAVDAFTEIGGDESASALAIVLHDDDVSLREEVVYALGEIGGTTAVSLLAQAQADPESHIQAAATELLDQLSD
jgi:HEAT repeat protein